MREIDRGYVGASLPRREDNRLLRGDGRFVADIALPGMVHAHFLRSPFAHAEIAGIDLAAARGAEGVVCALSGADLAGILPPIRGMQVVAPKGWRDRVDHRIHIPDQPLIPHDRLRYVGEAYALIVARDRYQAEDAAALVAADLRPLTPSPNAEAALADGAPQIHDGNPGNLAAELRMAKGRGEAALADCPRRIRRRIGHHRYAAMPMECRAVAAQYDSAADSLTVWSATQVVHWVRREVATALEMPEERVRCIAPDVGGGFGGKGHVYPEDILVAYLARSLRRPVRWEEDRREHILNSAHSRDAIIDMEIGFDDDGKLLVVHNSITVDSGAYSPVGATILGNTMAHQIGPYEIPHYESEARLVLSNRTPNAPYRGAGRPEAVFAMERMIDLVATELGMDPVELRLRNMIPADSMPYDVGLPYRDGVPIVYDSGDYPAALRRALDALGGLDAFRARQRSAWAAGRYLGLGISCYTEGTGVGPFESATVRIDPSGMIVAATGACSQGQGHETVFAQVIAEAWDVPVERVVVTIADTAAISMGYGTIASRSAVTSSSAIWKASEAVQKKVLAIAANMLETAVSDLEFRGGGVGVRGVPELSASLQDVYRAAKPGWDHRRPPGMEPGLEATSHFEPPTVTWSYAATAAIVKVDAETGRIAIERLVEVHDAGTLLNPMIADGQVKGGLVQGIGAALLEDIVYDSEGQILTGSLMDYLLPTATDVPHIEVIHCESPSPLNPLGVKGLGEGGAIAPPAAIANAVADALRPLGAEFNDTPLRWHQVLEALRKGRDG